MNMLFSFDACPSVHSGTVNQTTGHHCWNALHCVLQIWQARFQAESRHDPLRIFRKQDVAIVTWPHKFLVVKC